MEGTGRRGRELSGWLWRGALVGLIVLGVGGRLLMRVIAHMENRTQMVLTPGGALTVVFAGTVAGLLSGLIYYLLRRFVRSPWIRTALFLLIIEVITWRGVHGLLPRPKLMFMTLALTYIMIIDLLGRRIPVVR
jgi:hypothetical protein